MLGICWLSFSSNVKSHWRTSYTTLSKCELSASNGIYLLICIPNTQRKMLKREHSHTFGLLNIICPLKTWSITTLQQTNVVTLPFYMLRGSLGRHLQLQKSSVLSSVLTAARYFGGLWALCVFMPWQYCNPLFRSFALLSCQNFS